MDMTPQTWPEWYDGRHINEVLFCQQFLDKHPMKCVRGRLFTVDGLIEDEGQIGNLILEEISSVLTANLSKTVANLLASRFATVLERLAVSTLEISSRMRLPICPSSSISPSTVKSRPRTHFMGCLSKNCWQNSTSLMCLPSYHSGHVCGVISIFQFLLVNFL